MFKFARITLLALAAFFVLGFSITANAEPPWLADKEQMMKSAPLKGVSFRCMANNQTDSTIEVTWHFVEKEGTFEPHSPSDIDAGHTVTANWGSELKTIHCAISWVGRASDFRATFCAYETTARTRTTGCLELF